MNKTYEIKHQNLKSEITFLLATDLHYSSKKDIKKCDFILKEIKRDKPDYLLFGGDVLDKAIVEDEDVILEYFKLFAKETIVLIGLGNHDITTLKDKKTIYQYDDCFWKKVELIPNIFLLDNQSYEMKDFRVIGITLPYSYYYKADNIEEFLQKKIEIYDTKKMNILLVHAASGILSYLPKKELDKIDLVLSGHNHNGMVPLILEKFMKNRGLISPRKELFPKNVRGKFRKYHTLFIISGGITKLSKRSGLDNFDFFWNHELTKIVLKVMK